MSESITLPKSGLAAEVSAVISYPFACFVHGVGNESGQTREECIAKMDARVLALRAALLPRDAVIVTPDEATVERVAIAISDSDIACVTRIEQARAVLSALGVDHAK